MFHVPLPPPPSFSCPLGAGSYLNRFPEFFRNFSVQIAELGKNKKLTQTRPQSPGLKNFPLGLQSQLNISTCRAKDIHVSTGREGQQIESIEEKRVRDTCFFSLFLIQIRALIPSNYNISVEREGKPIESGITLTHSQSLERESNDSYGNVAYFYVNA